MSHNAELKKAAEAAVNAGSHWGRRDSFERQLVKLATPEAVLALIAENERLKTLRSVTERDLAQELEVWRHGPSCWSCGDTGDVHDIVGEWRGKCDCNAAKLIDVSYERDKLRAEVAGLKTGYEAYERVNTELKAEVERLDKLLIDASGTLRKASSWICREVDAGTKSATHWAIRLRETADQIDTALGQGEQS